jgi:allophanate hydrolase
MLRSPGGRGIALEVWALPKARLGTFVAGVPAPLGLGTVTLADGTAPKGFLVEAAGVVGAEDVTAFGCWRKAIAEEAA